MNSTPPNATLPIPPPEFCFAVLKKRELVVVYGCLDAEGLANVVAQHLPEGIVGKFTRQRQTARTVGRE